MSKKFGMNEIDCHDEQQKAKGMVKSLMKRVYDDPNDTNPPFRTLPIHKIRDIRARGGMVAVIGVVGNQMTESVITRSEAIKRAIALNEMIPGTKYASDVRELKRIVEKFMEAIKQAKTNDGGRYRPTKVSMAKSSMDAGKPLIVNESQVAKGHEKETSK